MFLVLIRNTSKSFLLKLLRFQFVKLLIILVRDLFMDDSVAPIPSPLISVQENAEKKEKEDKKEKNHAGIDKEKLKSTSFAKFKNYTTTSNTDKQDPEKKGLDKKKNTQIIRNMNRFVWIGRTHEYSILQLAPKKKSTMFQNSKFVQLFEQEHDLQQNVISYRDFKCAMI